MLSKVSVHFTAHIWFPEQQATNFEKDSLKQILQWHTLDIKTSANLNESNHKKIRKWCFVSIIFHGKMPFKYLLRFLKVPLV